MLNARFVSDIHLTSLSDQRGQSFLGLFKSWSGLKKNSQTGLTHLFLVGDIFDLWLADQPYFKNLYAPLIAEVLRLKSEGAEVHYFEGNHDLHLKTFWQNELGVQVHTGLKIFQLGKWKVCVEHGDEYDPSDRGYLFLRWLLRTPPLRFLAHHLPGATVVRMGEKASSSSRHYTDQVKTRPMQDSVERLHWHAKDLRRTRDFDLLINGHVHINDDFEWVEDGSKVRAINLGSWLKQPYGYLELRESGPQMQYI